MNFLSFDISTVKIGIGIWLNNKYDRAEYILFNSENLFSKIDELEALLNQIMAGNTFEYAVLESSYTAMFGGKSNAKTIAVLNQFNFGCQYLFHKLGLKVNLIDPKTARRLSYPGVSFGKGRDEAKEKVISLFREEFGDKFFKYKTLTRGPRKGQDVLEEWCEDIADAYVVGKAFSRQKQSEGKTN